MEAKEPIPSGYTPANLTVPHLRHFIMDRVENETDVSVLEQIYAIVAPKGTMSFIEKYNQAKSQTEQFCTDDIVEELEAEGYMIDKPYPMSDDVFDFEAAIRDDEHDDHAPQEWLKKMFPEIYAGA